MKPILTLLVMLIASGCSFIIDGAPNSYRPQRGGPPPSCSTSGVAPIVDGLTSITAVVLLVMQNREACKDPEDVNGCSIGSAVGKLLLGPPALIYGLAAIVGTAKVTHCNAVTREHAALQR